MRVNTYQRPRVTQPPACDGGYRSVGAETTDAGRRTTSPAAFYRNTNARSRGGFSADTLRAVLSCSRSQLFPVNRQGMELSACFTGCFYTQSTDKSLEHCSSFLGVSTRAHPGKPGINRCRSVWGDPFTAILGPEAPVNRAIIHRSTDKEQLFVVRSA